MRCQYLSARNGTVSFADLIHPGDRLVARAEIQQALREGRKFQLIYRILTATGSEKWVWEQGLGVHSSKGDLLAIEGFVSDITDRKNAEEIIKKANKQVALLTSITRHDIINQINSLKGYISMMKKQVTDEKIGSMLQKEESIAEMILRQIIFTREYENLGAGVPSWQSISPVIQRAFLEVQTDTVSLNIQEDNFEIFADPLLDKAFFLLFNYAYKYGDKVTKIDIYYLYTGERLIISIADNGSGISPENKIHLFDWKAGNEKTHGLYLVQKILSGTGITISETGEFKKGTRFEIIVPTDAFRTGFNPPQQKN